jgi:hypothetical protein
MVGPNIQIMVLCVFYVEVRKRQNYPRNPPNKKKILLGVFKES